jgi:hypothetical protein
VLVVGHQIGLTELLTFVAVMLERKA